MLPILNRTQETLFFSRDTFTKFLFLFVMFCIYPIVAKHFEMFFRDVDNQFLDEVQSRNSFSNSFHSEDSHTWHHREKDHHNESSC